MDKNKYGVHRTHCCAKHGCKYGEADCPVVSREITQDYLCESCDYDGIRAVQELLDDIDIPKIATDLFKKIEGWDGSANNLTSEDEYVRAKEKILAYIKRCKSLDEL